MLRDGFRKGAMLAGGIGMAMAIASSAASAACPVSWNTLRSNLQAAAAADSTGLNNHYWAVVVDREGTVCAVAFSGATASDQWLLSRHIAAAKAFTANGLSLTGASGPISTGMLYASVQPGAAPNPLFGLAAGNPLDPEAAYKGPASRFGRHNDPMVGKRVGGTITFGGGLGLYAGGASAIGGLGLSGDTACADHSTAWRLRILLGLAPAANDRMTLDNALDDFGDHPNCPNDGGTQGVN